MCGKSNDNTTKSLGVPLARIFYDRDNLFRAFVSTTERFPVSDGPSTNNALVGRRNCANDRNAWPVYSLR